MRARLPWLFVCGLAVGPVACSSGVEQAGGGGHDGTGGAPTGGGGPGGGGAGPVACTVTPREHPEACPAEPCAVTEDVEIACDDREVAAPGLRVGPSGDATWLVTASDRDRYVFRMADGAAERRDDGLPDVYARQTLTLAIDGAGRPHIGADATTFADAGNYPGGAEHAVLDGDAWTRSLVYDRPDKFVPEVDLEIGKGDVPHVWIVGDAPDEVVLAKPAADGSWATTPAATPAGGGGYRRFTLTSAGDPVGFDLVETGVGEPYQLTMAQAGAETPLGPTVAQGFLGYAVAPAPAPPSVLPAGPSVAVVLQSIDGLHVVWPDGGSYGEALAEGSEGLVPACMGYWGNGCPDPCHDTASGVETNAYAVARTADGHVWVAFVRTALDLQVHYVEHCDPEPGCYCEGVVDEDATTATLHLARIDTATGTPDEVLAMPIAPLQTADSFSSFWTPVRTVDLRGYGNDLAIGVRTRTGYPQNGVVRVLRISTGLL